MSSQIIGLGGGGFTMESNPLLDLYILTASTKKNPKICFLPTASGDNSTYIEHFKNTFGQYPCEPRYLTVMSPVIAKMEKFLLDSDIIYVGGGNTKSMLGLWREWGIDKILKQAYNQGIVLAGVSAGFVCWFEQCVTDSIPRKLTAMDCLGIIKGTGCPHYDGDSNRRYAFHKLLKSGEVGNGYAADDCVGLHFINGVMTRAVSSSPDASAYYLYQEMNGEVVEEPIKPEFLGTEEKFNQYLAPLFEGMHIEIEDDPEPKALETELQ